ncbi:MAG: hypothetical protein E7812_02785 [Phenylobacterium sp.]|nr:MAG: hypothetical protein E7812_02785 [Phenylobacterium sp.]
MGLAADPAGRCGAGWRESLYSAELGQAVCARVAAGASLREISAEPGMPDRTTVWKWAQGEPAFAEGLAAAQGQARTAARVRGRARMARLRAAQLARPRSRGGLATSRYCPDLAEAICERLANGESLKAIGRDPAMPCAATIYHWLERFPEFEAAYVTARRRQADTLMDEVREVGLAATPKTVWADRLHFDTLRWLTARLAPKKYLERLVVIQAQAEMAKADEQGPLRVVVVSFTSGPNGESLVAPPRCQAEADAWVRAYGRPYDGPGFSAGQVGPGGWEADED